MTWTLDHRPYNREGHPSVRPWRVLDGEKLFRAYTTYQIAIAALDLLQAGTVPSRYEIYRRLGHYGPKSKNHR